MAVQRIALPVPAVLEATLLPAHVRPAARTVGGWRQLSYPDAVMAAADVRLCGRAPPKVLRVTPGGPAQTAGVGPGFHVVAVNGDRQAPLQHVGEDLLLQLPGGAITI